MERKTIFADVILPVAVPQTYTYRIPVGWNENVMVGQRVVAQLGRSKLYTGIIRKLHDRPPEKYTAKYIESIIDEIPIVKEIQLKLWDWISQYYMCHLGEVMTAALPSSLKLTSETNIILNPDYAGYEELKDVRLITIVEAVKQNEVLPLSEVGSLVNLKVVQPLLKQLIELGIVLAEEELKDRYKPKLVDMLRLTDYYEVESNLEQLLNNGLERAPKQQDVLLNFIQMSNRYTDKTEVRKIDLQKKSGVSSSVVNELIKKQVFQLNRIDVSRLTLYRGQLKPLKQLSDPQSEAFGSITQQFEKLDTVLFHGVTGSGKTEVYCHLMQQYIQRGKQVLYLLPEIALTSQMINRLRVHFGDRIGVFHSKFNPNERVEVWMNTLNTLYQKYDILLGARSAMFLPFDKLGLIIVDEEHESSYKQHDPAPRYHARDCALVLAKMHGAKVLLGSATPSVESHWHAQNGTYGYVALNTRFAGIELPEIMCADLTKERKSKTMRSIFSSFLFEKMTDALERNEQIILFQNRRGYAPMWLCETCSWSPGCPRCDVGLTYHKFKHTLKCHYCGYGITPPVKCEACGSSEVKLVGFGTEKIEEELQELFPKAGVARMDLDTTRSKNGHARIISDFEEKKVDILVGTQMISKGLDFENVSLVGILNADLLLHFPDFRAFEKAYQLMSQVSGRAGRKGKRGKVIIQTYNPNHWIVKKVMAHDYDGMYRQEVIERRNFNYPPFFRMIGITIKHRIKPVLDGGAIEFANRLKEVFGNRIFGPEYPSIPRINNMYRQQMFIKFERSFSQAKVKSALEQNVLRFKQHPDFKSCRIKIDVDPI